MRRDFFHSTLLKTNQFGGLEWDKGISAICGGIRSFFKQKKDVTVVIFSKKSEMLKGNDSFISKLQADTTSVFSLM